VANVIQITQSNFASEVTSAPTPVLLDFGAEWCGPCKALAPVVETLAKAYSGKLKVGYVDVTANPTLAQQFQVMSVPTLLFFRSGRIVRQVVGSRSKAELESLVEEVLS
jgi:thioredoxin 1